MGFPNQQHGLYPRPLRRSSPQLDTTLSPSRYEPQVQTNYSCSQPVVSQPVVLPASWRASFTSSLSSSSNYSSTENLPYTSTEGQWMDNWPTMVNPENWSYPPTESIRAGSEIEEDKGCAQCKRTEAKCYALINQKDKEIASLKESFASERERLMEAIDTKAKLHDNIKQSRENERHEKELKIHVRKILQELDQLFAPPEELKISMKLI